MTTTGPCRRCGAHDPRRVPGVAAYGAGYLFTQLPDPPELLGEEATASLGTQLPDPPEPGEEATASPWLYFDLLLCLSCGHGVLAAQEDGAPLPHAVSALAAATTDRRPCPACAGEGVRMPEAMEIEGAGPLVVRVREDAWRLPQGWLCASCGAVETKLACDAATWAAQLTEADMPSSTPPCLACGSGLVELAELGVDHAGAVYVPLRGVELPSNPRLGAAVCGACAALSFQVAPASDRSGA